MPRPALTVTFGLIVAGAIVGAICGLLALVPIPLQHAIRPTPDDGFLSASDVASLVAGIGAVLGALCGPTLAWSMLRRAPIWRVLLEPAIGTIIGSFVGWGVALEGWAPGIPAILLLALAGAVLAALRLRFVVHYESPTRHHEPAI